MEEKYPGELIELCDIIINVYKYGADSYREFDIHPDYTYEELDRAEMVLLNLILNLEEEEWDILKNKLEKLLT